MSCSSNPPSCSLRELGTRAAPQRARGLATLALATLLGGGACTGAVAPANPSPSGSGGTSVGQPGTGGAGASVQPGGGSGGTVTGGGGTGGTNPGTGSGGSGVGGAAVTSKGGVMLRLLTQTEYLASMQALLGTIAAPLTAPGDVSVAGFVSVGASHMSVTDGAATAYETATLAATAEVFADAARWQKLVGCTPANLDAACVTTYLKTFGKNAWRRDLTNEEVTQWLGVAKSGVTLGATIAQSLAAATSGLLQSPFFLYRVETNKLDAGTGRLKYDGLSMATRLSYFLTGAPPSAALLTSATSGQLDTADGVRTAAAPLLTNTAAVSDRMTAFFSEYAQVQQVLLVDKSRTMFPTFNETLKNSMLQATRMFLKNVVLAPNADVRGFYDSPVTYVDANVAPLYGVSAPASGFAQVTLPASTGRAGILGQASVMASQSHPDRTSPTRRGIFVLDSLLCTPPPLVPGDVDTALPVDQTQTMRKILEAHRKLTTCSSCHQAFDPMGLALEHFDAIGKYRETENGQPIDATGTLGTKAFDGAVQLGTVLKEEPRAIACLLRNLYRNANGREEDDKDPQQITALVQALSTRNYVWSSFLTDFVTSEAFRSAPALPVKTGS